MRCRSDGDVWCVERPDGRWNVNTNAGTKTSRKTQAAAQAFCAAARLNPSLLLPKTKAAAPTGRSSRHATYEPPPTKARAKYGSLVKPSSKSSDPAAKFHDVIAHLAKNPHQKKSTLGGLAMDAALEGQLLLKVNAELQDAFDSAKKQLLQGCHYDPSGIVNSKAVEDILGEGYGAQQERTFRRHRHCIMSKIRDICGDDTRQQAQLLEGCLQAFKVEPAKNTLERTALEIISGISKTLQTMRMANKGRTPTHLRVAQQSLHAAATCEVTQVQSRDVAALLGTSNRHQLVAAQAIGKAFNSNETDRPYVEKEASCNKMDPVWEAKVKALWLSGTRPSENKKDEVKNPHHRKDPTTYRVRFLERTLEEMVEFINETGRREVCPDFEVSRFYVAALKPFYVKRPGRCKLLLNSLTDLPVFCRDYSLCRYHMEWEYLCHALKSWSRRSITTDCLHPTITANEHSMRSLMMCAKPTEFESRYYGIKCASRTCVTCQHNLKKLTCSHCVDKLPRVTWMKWDEKPYICADGRQVMSHDFIETTTSITEFLTAFENCMRTFFTHHDRAKWQDDDWSVAWENPLLFGSSLRSSNGWVVASVEDFSMSYTHRPKREHAGRFFHSISTSIYGCIMRIPLAAFKESFMSLDERTKLEELFQNCGVPPVLTICTFGVSPDQGHDTAFVQHYHLTHVEPWLESNCHPIQVYLMRSDGCTGQFKCGRHFRWLSTHSCRHEGQMKIQHSHSESCHGKDMSDPECGRLKYLLESREMKHSHDVPTQMDTSEAAFAFMEASMQPKRTLFDKKGVGVYKRVFFFVGAKDVKHNMAECKGVDGSSTFHEFTDIGREGYLNCRVLSCHRCIECQDFHPDKCLNSHRTGPQLLRQVQFKSGARIDVPLTRSSVAINGRTQAEKVEIGMIFSVELDDMQEPWMLARAISPLHKYEGPNKSTWMGEIRPGDMIINVVKLDPISAGSSTFTDQAINEMPVFDTDVRLLHLKLAEVEVRATRHKPSHKRYTLSAADRDAINSASAVV